MQVVVLGAVVEIVAVGLEVVVAVAMSCRGSLDWPTSLVVLDYRIARIPF